jgi:biotin carboxyl carrier protein
VRFVDLPQARGTARPPQPAKAPAARGASAAHGNDVLAPMHGVVAELPLAAGAPVAAGDVVAVIEAMKMMNEIRAHRAGRIAAVHVAPGATVEARTRLLTLE